MEQNLLINGETLGASQEGMLAIELYLITHYLFRRNVLNSTVEFAVKPAEGQVPQWKALTQSALNSIIIRAKRDNACDGGSPKSDIVEYVNSDEIDTFDPIADYLEHLPKWDGENQVAKLFHRLPGIDFSSDSQGKFSGIKPISSTVTLTSFRFATNSSHKGVPIVITCYPKKYPNYLQYFPLFAGVHYLFSIRLHVSQSPLQFYNSFHQLVKI